MTWTWTTVGSITVSPATAAGIAAGGILFSIKPGDPAGSGFGSATLNEIRGWYRAEPLDVVDPIALADIKAKLAAGDPYIWSNPVEVVIVEGKTYVVNGNHRITAVVESGYTGKIPYRIITEAEAKASYGFDPNNNFGTFGGAP